jgi:hypothetical protein
MRSSIILINYVVIRRCVSEVLTTNCNLVWRVARRPAARCDAPALIVPYVS